ncbi:phosphoribosyltransferase family protein [Compostibacter hankyongensis]
MQTIILDEEKIRWKVRRMAYEIYERNSDKSEIILAGIPDRGTVLAGMLAAVLQEIAGFRIRTVALELDKDRPLDVKVVPATDFDGTAVVVVDDVANSGRTLLYAMKPLLEKLPEKIQTAVLVDRMHKSFPVLVDYIGYSLSTTLQEHISVDIRDGCIRTVYLA